MHMQVPNTIWRPQLKIAIARKWRASYWFLWASLCLVSMKKHTFLFLLLIRTGEHLSVYMAAQSGYQISDIDIFLMLLHVRLCTQIWWTGGFTVLSKGSPDCGKSYFTFKSTWHLHYLRPDPFTLELEDRLQVHVTSSTNCACWEVFSKCIFHN